MRLADHTRKPPVGDETGSARSLFARDPGQGRRVASRRGVFRRISGRPLLLAYGELALLLQ